MSGRRLPVAALALVVAALALSTGGVAGPTDAGTGTVNLSGTTDSVAQSNTATVDTNADIDNDGSVDELSVPKADGQTISGTATVPTGTELDIRVTGTDSGSPFVKPLTATVQSDDSWRTTADFSGNAQGANFTVRVERNGTALLSEPVDGRIYEQPTGSVTFNDQQSDGDAVTVFSATASDGGFVTIRPNVSGNSLGTSEYIPPGSEGDIRIPLDRQLDEDTTLVAMLHRDTDGDQTYEFEFGSSVDAPYTENGSAVTDSAEITVGPLATVDTNADTDDDGAVDELSVQKASGQAITGTSAVEPGTELDIRVTGTDSGSPFVKPLTATVQSDGSWTTTADFSGNAQGANFTVTVERNGTSLLEAPVDGRIAEQPTGSVTFNDQETFGSTVTVASVTLSDGGFVTIRNATDDGLGTSEYIEAGSDSDIEISLTEPLDEDTTLVAMLHQDTDGDQTYEFELGSSVDAPYYENGSAVTDSADITLAAPANVSVSIDGTNAPVTAGETLTVTADVENVGDLAGTQEVTLSDGDGTVLDRQSVSLGAAATESVTLSWATSEADVGDRTLSVASENDTATTTATVEAPPDSGPVAVDDSYRLRENETLRVEAPGVVENDDADGGTLTASVVDDTENGTLSLSADGSFTYTPDPGFSGSEEFTYRVTDGDGATATATVTLSVDTDSEPVDPPTFSVALTSTNTPVEAGDRLRVTADVENTGGTAGTQEVSLSDGDGTVLDRRSVSLSTGTSEDVTLSWATTESDVGTSTLTVATDNDTASRTVTVVSSSNSGPVARDDSYLLKPNTTFIVPAPAVVGNDSDPTGGDLTASLVEGADHGRLSLSDSGAFVYEPDPGFTGRDTFTYAVSDGAGETAAATVSLLVDTPTFAVGVTSTNGPVEAGEDLRVTVTVENRGAIYDTQSVELRDPAGRTVDSTTVALGPGASTSRTLVWSTTAEDTATDTVTVVTPTGTTSESVGIESAPGGDEPAGDSENDSGDSRVDGTDGDSDDSGPDSEGTGGPSGAG